MDDPREGPRGFERARLRGSIAQRLFGEAPVRLERYLVLERVGQGGMGIVYRAFDPRLERVVALKVTRLHERGSQRERLLREAKVLARLNHPHVLTVHDAGMAGDELFVATEFVQAGTLGDWCEAHPPREPGRAAALVELALQAAKGLAVAHEAGLVHRDIKPSNLMVGEDGRLRVADFGLARELQADTEDTDGPSQTLTDAEANAVDSAPRGHRTRTGTLLGTPAYMAPEQFHGAASERSDQFSWAVTFYEAYAGARPFADPEAAAGGDAPIRPASGREIPEPVRRVLLRCLQVAPSERYESMAAVAAALEASRRGRARWILPAAAGAGVLAIGWVALAPEPAAPDPTAPDPCVTARSAVEDHWNETRREEVRSALTGTSVPFAKAAADRVDDALSRYAQAWDDGRVDACEAVHVRHEQSPALMDARMRCLDDRARRLDAAVALLSKADDALMARVVPLTSALPAVEACGDPEYVTASAPPPSDANTAEKVTAQERRLAESRTLVEAGRYGDARELGDSIVETARELEHDPLLASALAGAGWATHEDGDSEAGGAALREAIMVAQRSGDDEALIHAAIHLVHVDALGRDRREAAATWADLARATLKRAGGDRAVDEARLERELGRVASHHGDLDGALVHYERVLDLLRPRTGDDDPRVAGTMHDIAIAHARTRRFDAAEPVLREALATYRRVYGDRHPQTASVLANTGNIALELGQFAEALALHEESLRVREAALGEQHPAVVSNLMTLASLHKRRDEHARALPLLERALAVAEATKGPKSSLTGRVVMLIGNVHSDSGDRRAAVPFQRRALEILTQTRGPNDPVTITSMHNLANELYFGNIDVEEALGLYEQAMEATAANGTTPSPVRISTLANIAAVHRSAGREQESLTAARQSLALAEELDASASFQGIAHFELARALWRKGAPTEAIAHAEQARDHWRASAAGTDAERLPELEAWLAAHPAPEG